MSTLLSLIILAVAAYSIYDVYKSPNENFVKVLWVLGIVFFPIFGSIIWFVLGPRMPKI